MKTIKEGDILYSTFGYDAQIVCFWKVLKRSAKQATLARLNNITTGDCFDGSTVADLNSPTKEIIRKKVGTWASRNCESVNTGYGVTLHWDGEPLKTYNHH